MRNPSHGFTLLELMIGLAIGAILLGIAVPSFTAIIRQNRIANQTNEFMVTLALARSEAVKRGTRVSICSSNVAQTACSGATDWGNGWLLLSDPVDPAGAVNIDGAAPDDRVLQAFPAPSQSSMRATSGRAFLSYGSDGRADVATLFTISPPFHTCAGDDARTINVNLSGRATKAATACPP
jgi:type IV fimbrial biogenesis protein FimT